VSDQRRGFRVVERAVDLGGRVPPHNDEAEAAVISSILSSKSALEVVLGIADFTPSAFYSDANRRIVEAAIELHAGGSPVDVLTVGAFLRDRERLQAVGGMSYIAKIIDATPAVAHVDAHAMIVLEKSRIRRLIENCQLIAAEGYGDYGDAQTFLDDAEHRVHQCARTVRDEDASDIHELVMAEERRLDDIAEGKVTAGGIPTSYYALDEILGGFRDGEVTIVCGRPRMGKSAFAGNVAVRIAREPHDGWTIGVLFVSIEMPKHELVQRMAASEAMVNGKRLIEGKLTPGDREKIRNAHIMLDQLPISIDDSSHVTPLKFRARVRRAQTRFAARGPKHRLGLVVVDYVQRMKADDVERGMSKEQQVGACSTAVAETAKELRVPVLELAQLNRDVEARGKSMRPQLSDLRDSGQLEQDAHNIVAIHRPEVYVSDKDVVAEDIRGLAELIVLKQRSGAQGTADLHYFDFCTRFDNRKQS
jgi:replicative DNA helicase